MIGIWFLKRIEEGDVSSEKARESEPALRKKLGKKKLKIFEEQIIPYLNDPNSDEDKYRFDLSIAQRWILQKVFDLGWTVECFGEFDRNLSDRYYRREANKPERIGKKYQWIAYHEFLARVSDNFEFKGNHFSDRSEKYEGPWQIGYIRDIDPSSLLRKTKDEGWKPQINTWWFPSSYNAWDLESENIEWLKNFKDLPPIEPLIEVTNPRDGSRWLVLESFYNWEQPAPPDEAKYEIPRPHIYYMLKSYIVNKSNMDEVYEWAKKQNFMGRWMPESRDIRQIFLGEIFWASGYKYCCIPYYGYEEWTHGGKGDNTIPKDVLVTAERYLWGSENYDCSIDDSIHIYLACKWLADRMNLRWNGVEGHFLDDKGNLITCDPSVRTSGPGALLINRDALLKFLNDNEYDMLWTILGEKYMIGGGMSPEEYRGYLEINGTFRINQYEKVEGVVTPKFHPRR